MRSRLTNLLLLALLASGMFSTSSYAVNYDFGFTCRTNGPWVNTALTQTQRILETLNALKSNESCSGIESLFSDLQAAQSMLSTLSENTDKQTQSKTEGDKALLNSAIANTESTVTNSVLGVVADLHMNSAIAQVASYTSRLSEHDRPLPFASESATAKAVTALTQTVNKVMALLPGLDTCLVNAPNQGLAMLSGVVSLGSALVSPGAAVYNANSGNFIANFVDYLRQSRFAKVAREMHQNELWMSITCALEQASMQYCQVKDNIKLMEWGIDQVHKNRGVEAAGNAAHPIAGYYLMIRNVPTITDWLLKVQFGVVPKLATDATFKNNVWQTTTSMIQTTNNLLGLLYEGRLTLPDLGSLAAKKSELLKLVNSLSYAMESALFGAKGSSMINFFTTRMPAKILPLYLIGIDAKDMPQELKPNAEGKFVMPVGDWILNVGNYRPMFNDPEKLIDTIEYRLRKLFEDALKETQRFFIRRLIVDMPNLVAEAFRQNSLTTSVVESLHFVDAFLLQLRERILRSKIGDYQLIPVIDDTSTKVRRVLTAFDDMLQHDRISESTTDVQSRKIIETVYDNFNVLLQRDSFITNRMSTFVFYDYYLRLAEGEDFSRYEADLMIVSNEEMLIKLMSVYEDEPALNREELQTAMMLNRRNIDALEYLFRDNFFDFLQQIEDEALGRTITYRNMRVLGRVNSEVPWYLRYTPIAAYFQISDYLFGPTYKYKLSTNNIFNPQYYRGDTEHQSFVAVRNRVCMSLLAFQKPQIFNEFCHKASIQSPFVMLEKTSKRQRRVNDQKKTGRDLSIVFNNFVDTDKNKVLPGHDERICAYRDYLRRNQVYWLTRQRDDINKRRFAAAKKIKKP